MSNKILIVEDDMVSGKLLGQIILNLGYELTDTISSAEGALNSIKTKKPDLVLMDITLSGVMDGIHTSELLYRYYNIPVVFVTNHSDEDTILKAKKNGIGYIIKPVFEKEIKDVLSIAFRDLKNKQIDHCDNAKENAVKIIIKDEEKILFLDLYDISYFESQGHTLLMYTNGVTYAKRGCLKKYEGLDVKKGFFRCHKSFLININNVAGLICEDNYKYQIKIKDSQILIPLSKNKVKAFKKYL